MVEYILQINRRRICVRVSLAEDAAREILMESMRLPSKSALEIIRHMHLMVYLLEWVL